MHLTIRTGKNWGFPTSLQQNHFSSYSGVTRYWTDVRVRCETKKVSTKPGWIFVRFGKFTGCFWSDVSISVHFCRKLFINLGMVICFGLSVNFELPVCYGCCPLSISGRSRRGSPHPHPWNHPYTSREIPIRIRVKVDGDLFYTG